MRKTFKLMELGCPNCAAKMEAAIAKIDGVSEVSIQFMAQKLTIDMADEKANEIMQKAQKAVRAIERDCVIVL